MAPRTFCMHPFVALYDADLWWGAPPLNAAAPGQCVRLLEVRVRCARLKCTTDRCVLRSLDR
eukprot:1443574-Prymnesium_polylepis.2